MSRIRSPLCGQDACIPAKCADCKDALSAFRRLARKFGGKTRCYFCGFPHCKKCILILCDCIDSSARCECNDLGFIYSGENIWETDTNAPRGWEGV